jgi:hypothetical protein
LKEAFYPGSDVFIVCCYLYLYLISFFEYLFDVYSAAGLLGRTRPTDGLSHFVWGIEKRIPILFVVSSNPAAHCVSLSLSFSLLKPTAIFGLYVDGLLFVYMPTDLCVSTVDRVRERERGRKEEEEKRRRGFILIECLYYIQFIFLVDGAAPFIPLACIFRF